VPVAVVEVVIIDRLVNPVVVAVAVVLEVWGSGTMAGATELTLAELTVP
jgi:hypothetical protein